LVDELITKLDKAQKQKKAQTKATKVGGILYRNLKEDLMNEKTRLNGKINQLEKEKKDLTDQLANFEKTLITKVITELGLELPAESGLSQVIQLIKELINKPPVVENNKDLEKAYQVAQNTIRELREKLVEEKKNNSSGEDLKVIIELELTSLTKLFGVALDSQVQQQIREANSYSQVVEARQAFLVRHLGSQSGSAVVSPTSRLPERIV
jgi:vacuolar-type H+-ATPase subunit I/STV1